MAQNKELSIGRVRSAIIQIIGQAGLEASEAAGRLNIIHSDDLVAKGLPFEPSMPFSPTLTSVGSDFIDAFDDLEGFLAAEEKEQRKRLESIGDIEYIAIVRHPVEHLVGKKPFQRWLMILEDASTPGCWRTQSFDTNGLYGHVTYATKEKAMRAAVDMGFTVRDDEALDRIQDTPAFQRGVVANDLIMKVNDGRMSFADAQIKLGEYDAIQSTLASIGHNGAQAFVTGKDKTLYLVADRIKAGDEQAVFLHEVTHRWGKKVMEPATWDNLIGQLKAWELKDVNSTERFIHTKATQRIRKAKTNSSSLDEELFAYAVEEAVALGIKPSALAHPETASGWLESVSKSLKQIIEKAVQPAATQDPSSSFLEKDLSLQDVVDMAYAMAQLDSPQRMSRILSSMTQEDQSSLKSLLNDVREKGPGKNLFKDIGRDLNDLGMYSELAFQLEKVTMKHAPADKWSGIIQGLTKKGVKRDEIEWSGVNDWLSLQEGRISREDVVSFVKSNGVQISQTTLHGEKTATELKEAMDTGINPVATARYGSYKVPGGRNYREVLLRTADRVSLRYTVDNVLAIPPSDKDPSASRPDLFWYFKTPDNLFQISKNKHADQSAALDYILRDKQPALPFDKNYKSKHFAKNNIVAHLRLDDRVDAQGKKVLFVHEVQSDWGQDGKRHKFRKPESELPAVPVSYKDIVLGDEVAGWGKVQNIRESDTGRDFDIGGLWIGQDKFTLDKVANRNHGLLDSGLNEQRVPSGPFVSTTEGWLSLAIKRTITLAVEEGHDRVAFITGSQAVDLYDIRKFVKQVNYEKTGDDSYDYTNIYLNKKQPETFKNQTLAEVESQLGKVIARNMSSNVGDEDDENASGVKVLRGMNLSVGDKGMRAFYDTIVPNTLKDVLRRLGVGSVESFNVPAEQHNGYDRYEIGQSFHGTPAVVGIRPDGESVVLMVNGDANENLAKLQAGRAGSQQIGFDITDEMRAKVMQGMPMFSMEHRIDSYNFDAWCRSLPIVRSGQDDFEGGAAVFLAYHGSTHGDITEFKRTGCSDGFLGAGSYFSTSSLDASANYAGVGPDRTARINQAVENFASSFDDDDYVAQNTLKDYFESEGIEIEITDENLADLKEEYRDIAIDHAAKSQVTGDNEGVMYPVYVRLRNPADTTGAGPDFTYNVRENEIGDILEESGTLVDWMMAAKNVCDGYHIDVGDYFDSLIDAGRDRGYVGMDRVFDLARKHLSEAYDDSGDLLSTGAVFAEIAEEAGFDGVIMDADLHFGSGRRGFGGVVNSMANVEQNTLHVMPFKSSQVKSIFNCGAFDPESNDIRFSIAIDSEQKMVVANDGAPVTMYHGSPESNILKFDTNREGNPGERGTFFSEKKEVAASYGENVYSAHLRMENPYEATSRQWASAEGITPAQARDAGHDGYIIRGLDGKDGDAVIVFDPQQVQLHAVENTNKPVLVENAEKAIAFISESEQVHKKPKIH